MKTKIIFLFFCLLLSNTIVACSNQKSAIVSDDETIIGNYKGIPISKEKLKDMQNIVNEASLTEGTPSNVSDEQYKQDIYDPKRDGVLEEAQRTSIPEGALSIDDMKIILEEYKEFLK